MTTNEEKSIQRLNTILSEIKEENNKFRSELSTMVEKLSNKVEHKHMPIQLEGDILSSIQSAMNKAIEETLKGYNSPLLNLISQVVESRSGVLKEIITQSFDKAINIDDFKQSIVDAFSHKVARTIISNNTGLFDKVSNELKQDAIFKSKMQIAVANVVEECIKLKTP